MSNEELFNIFKILNKGYFIDWFIETECKDLADYLFEKIKNKELILKTSNGLEIVKYEDLYSDRICFQFCLKNDVLECDLTVFDPYEYYWYKGHQYVKNAKDPILRFTPSFDLPISFLQIIKERLLNNYRLHLETLYQEYLLEQETAKKEAWINFKSKELLSQQN